MKLRLFDSADDFDALSSWVADERIHALWCAGRTKYPLEKDDLLRLLEDHAVRYGDIPFTAEDADGRAVGFFCLAPDKGTETAMLRFVVLDPALRGKGLGREMISLAADCAFSTEGAKAVQLAVFAENTAARRCYRSAGFEEVCLTEKAFRFKDEEWGRLLMVKKIIDN